MPEIYIKIRKKSIFLKVFSKRLIINHIMIKRTINMVRKSENNFTMQQEI